MIGWPFSLARPSSRNATTTQSPTTVNAWLAPVPMFPIEASPMLMPIPISNVPVSAPKRSWNVSANSRESPIVLRAAPSTAHTSGPGFSRFFSTQ